MRGSRKRGGLIKPSTRAKTAKIKQKNISMAEKNVLRKEKKLETEKAKLLKMNAKRDELKQKVDLANGLYEKAIGELDYYKRQLTYSDLQETN